MADNIGITTGSDAQVATDEIGGVHWQKFKIAFGPSDTATAVETGVGLPVALAANQSVNLAQIGGTNVLFGNGITGAGVQRVSIASDNTAFAVNATLQTGANVIGAVTQSGTWNVGSITTLPALVAGSAIIGKVGIDQTTPGTTNAVSVTNTSLAVTGTFFQATQPVSLASNTPTIAAGSAVIGKVGIDQTTPGTTNLVALAANQSVNNAQIGGVTVAVGSGVTGTGVQRVTLATDVALPTGANTIGTTTGPTLTKGTQGAAGYSTQDLKDAGRAIVNAATAIAGVTAVTTEALVALNVSRDGAATASLTTIPVTSGKRWRITGLMVSGISTAAAVFSARISIRMNPAGTATASSPIIATVGLTQQAAALAQAGDSGYMAFPDGIEVSGAMQVGVSQVANVITGTLWVSLIGYEY